MHLNNSKLETPKSDGPGINKPGSKKSGLNKQKLLQWQKDIIRFFLPFAIPERLNLASLCVLNILMICTNAFLIWTLGRAISQISSGNFDLLNQTLLIIAGMVLLNQLVRFIYTYIMQRVSLRFVDRVRGRLLENIMYLSFPLLQKHQKGDLISRLTGDVDRMLTFVISMPMNIFTNALILLVYSSILFWIDWQLSLVVLAMAPFFFFSQHYVAPKAGALSRTFTIEKAKLVSFENQVLDNLKGISSINIEEQQRKQHKRQFNIARMWALKARKINILYGIFFTILLYIAGVVVIYSGVHSIETGSMTIGILVSYLIYVRNLTAPVRAIARLPVQMQVDRVAANRLMEIMQMRSHIANDSSDELLNIQQGKIDFQQLSFSYPSQYKPVFVGFNASINAGETVALVGASGSGKSTLANLLMRFYDPQHGKICIDDIDIRSVSVTSLRDQVSVVWQEGFVFSGTIEENLRLAKPDASDKQLVDACNSSYACEFIEQLEHGLKTIIGTDGINLSAGQLQRLAIAQAFLRDSPILILDEASSALDSHSEQKIAEALEMLRKNRTTLIIAHRFSSIRNADRILYFSSNDGIISGKHKELMEKYSDYRKAVKWQISEMESD